MSKPFFSIAMPTYNRPNFLRTAIKSVLVQNYSDFEIVVTDNSTNDQSKIVCQQFHDKRIRYFKNETSIGFARNLYRSIKESCGQYIFLLGDDDFIYKNTTLSTLYALIKTNHYGYIRLGVWYHKNLEFLFDIGSLNNLENPILQPHSNNLEIVEFIYKTNFTYISGLVFQNYNLRIKELEKTKDPNFQMEHFWIKFIFKPVQQKGGYLSLDDVIISRFFIVFETEKQKKDIPDLYRVVNNKIYFEKTWKLVLEELSKKEKEIFMRDKLAEMVPLLPSVKYYSSNKNLLLFVKRMLELNPSLYFNVPLYFSLTIALFMPNRAWAKLRNIYHWLRQVHINDNAVSIAKLKSKLGINYKLT